MQKGPRAPAIRVAKHAKATAETILGLTKGQNTGTNRAATARVYKF